MIFGQKIIENLKRIGQKLDKIAHNTMKNMSNTPNLTNMVGVHLKNTHKKFEANPCSGLREEVKKDKSSRRQQRHTGWLLESHSLIECV